MTQKVDYEWVVEELDADGDIIECHYFSEGNRAKAEAHRASIEGSTDFGLCRHKWSEADGETDRQYAYFEDGKLPCCFDGGNAVPKRFV